MRAPALATLLVPLLAQAACGRVGYDELAADGPAGPDGGGPDAAWTATPCDTPVQVADLGASVTPRPAGFALDVAATTTGFVAVYNVGNDEVSATGVAVDAAGRFEVIQSRGLVTSAPTLTLSVAALGDLVELGVDDPDGGRIALHDLDAWGYNRGDVAYLDGKRPYGHNFVTADAPQDRFLVVGSTGSEIGSFTVDHDGDLIAGPVAALATPTEGASAGAFAGGYLVFSGQAAQCDLVVVDTDLTPAAPAQSIAMTCHNASAVAVPGSPNVIAAWNCDNDAVWLVAGDPTMTLPGYVAVFGDASMSASNPRVVATSAGVWYAYQVVGGRLGRALLAADGTPVAGGAAADVHQSPRVVAYDLISRGDAAFLVWLESETSDELWAMRLCAP